MYLFEICTYLFRKLLRHFQEKLKIGEKYVCRYAKEKFAFLTIFCMQRICTCHKLLPKILLYLSYYWEVYYIYNQWWVMVARARKPDPFKPLFGQPEGTRARSLKKPTARSLPEPEVLKFFKSPSPNTKPEGTKLKKTYFKLPQSFPILKYFQQKLCHKQVKYEKNSS